VGTAFNVDLRPSGVQVTVSEGVVKVAGGGVGGGTPSDAALSRAAVSVLTAGEQVDMHGHIAAIRSLKPSELLHSVAWRQGTVNFENQPLGAVIEEVSRYTDLHIEIGDDALRQLPVGGTFRADPDGVEALLTMLQEGLGLTVNRDGQGGVTIEGQPAR